MHTVSSFGVCQGMSWQNLNQLDRCNTSISLSLSVSPGLFELVQAGWNGRNFDLINLTCPPIGISGHVTCQGQLWFNQSPGAAQSSMPALPSTAQHRSVLCTLPPSTGLRPGAIDPSTRQQQPSPTLQSPLLQDEKCDLQLRPWARLLAPGRAMCVADICTIASMLLLSSLQLA